MMHIIDMHCDTLMAAAMKNVEDLSKADLREMPGCSIDFKRLHEARAMAQEQLAALEERTFAGMEVLQREVSGQELPDRFRLEGVYLCVEDIGEEREILTGEEIPGLEPPAGAVKGAE